MNKTLHERILEFVESFIDGIRFSQLYTGLNNNQEYPHTRRQDVLDALAIMVEGKIIYKSANGRYHLPRDKGVILNA